MGKKRNLALIGNDRRKLRGLSEMLTESMWSCSLVSCSMCGGVVDRLGIESYRVVVLCLPLAGCDYDVTISTIRERSSDARILVIVSSSVETSITQVLRVGADGVLLGDPSPNAFRY